MNNLKNALKILPVLLLLVLVSCKKKSAQPDVDVTTGLHVKDGKYLSDKCGNKVVLRGVNMGSVYAVNFGLKELEEIDKTGANAVRIVLKQQYEDWSKGGALTDFTAAKIEPIIALCLTKRMIPVLQLHDYTGSANITADLAKASQWWTKSDMKAVLSKYQKSIIINIANEPDNGSADSKTFANANLAAIQVLRNAGYTCPIMIDAPNWGKDHNFFVSSGQMLMNADPLHGLLFSVHAYWPTDGLFGNYSDAKIIVDMNALKQTGLPIVLGELAWADIQNNRAYKINYRLLMKLCQQNEFGYLAWWWGFYNNPGANNQLSMTSTGLYEDLKDAGFVIAYDDLNSILDTSKRICK